MIKPQFIFAFDQQFPGLLFGVTDSGWVALNVKGKFLFKAFPYDNGPDYFSDGLMRIVQNNRIGYVNKKGKVVIAPIYTYAEPFNNGKAKVSQVERHTYHDPKLCNHYHNTYDVIGKRGRITWDKNEDYNPLRETPKN